MLTGLPWSEGPLGRTDQPDLSAELTRLRLISKADPVLGLKAMSRSETLMEYARAEGVLLPRQGIPESQPDDGRSLHATNYGSASVNTYAYRSRAVESSVKRRVASSSQAAGRSRAVLAAEAGLMVFMTRTFEVQSARQRPKIGRWRWQCGR